MQNLGLYNMKLETNWLPQKGGGGEEGKKEKFNFLIFLN